MVGVKKWGAAAGFSGFCGYEADVHIWDNQTTWFACFSQSARVCFHSQKAAGKKAAGDRGKTADHGKSII